MTQRNTPERTAMLAERRQRQESRSGSFTAMHSKPRTWPSTVAYNPAGDRTALLPRKGKASKPKGRYAW